MLELFGGSSSIDLIPIAKRGLHVIVGKDWVETLLPSFLVVTYFCVFVPQQRVFLLRVTLLGGVKSLTRLVFELFGSCL